MTAGILLPLTAGIILIAGCVTIPAPIERNAAADRVAAAGGFERSRTISGPFTLTSYQRIKNPGAPVNIYIEGDGISWITEWRLSDDPTPREPLVLELASADPAENVVYLARPGQYCAGGPDCPAEYWSGRRFSKAAVDAMDRAIDEIRQKSGAKEIGLIGYSGGAAIAAIIAARRNDVKSLRTIAGNLDTDAVNRYHRVSALSEDSLNPIDDAPKLASLPQRHYVGSRDTVIPAFIARKFASAAGDSRFDSVTIVEGAGHTKGWRERWQELLAMRLK